MKEDRYTFRTCEKLTTADAIKIAHKYAYCHGRPQEDVDTMRLFYAICEYTLRVHYKLMRYINPKMRMEPDRLSAIDDMAQDEVNWLLAGIAEKEKRSVVINQNVAAYEK